MNNLSIFGSSANVKMTSKEIAELVEKRHDNVKRTIEVLSNQGLITHPQTEDESYKDGSGRTVTMKVYVFDEDSKRDTYVLVAQLSPEFTARIVDRWIELESEKALKNQYAVNLLPAQVGEATIDSMMRVASKWNVPPSYAMQVASIEATKQTGMPWDRLLTQAKIMENVPQSDVMLEPTDLGKLFGMSAKEMNIWLYERGLQVKKADSWVPTEEGAQYCQRHAWARGNKSGYNLKWNAAAIEEMMKVAA